MNKSHFEELARFNLWANGKIVAFITDKFTEGQEEREIVSSFSSVRKTIYHLWDAETVWLERLKGNSNPELPGDTFNGSFLDGMRGFMSRSSELLDFLSGQNENFFAAGLSYVHSNGTPYTHPVTEVFTHVFNHSTFHRGQLITMFRQLGFTEGIPKTDFIAFVREMQHTAVK